MDLEKLWKTADMNGGNNVSILDLTAVALGKDQSKEARSRLWKPPG